MKKCCLLIRAKEPSLPWNNLPDNIIIVANSIGTFKNDIFRIILSFNAALPVDWKSQ